MTIQQVLETCLMPSQNAVMKYLLMIFLIFVGCSEYPPTKINCMTASYAGGVKGSESKSYAFVDSNLFKDAEVEIFNTYPSTFKCRTYFQNNSSIKCFYEQEEVKLTEIFYNKLDQTIRHEVTYRGFPKVTKRGVCEDA